MNYIIHVLIMINIYVILSVSTNLLVGMPNLLSLGQAAFYGIGAYITVLCLMILKFPLVISLIVVLLFTALSSLVIALPALRLKGDFFVLATLGFQLIIYTILYNWTSVTRGAFGIPGIPAPKLFGVIKVSGIYSFLILSLILAGVTIVVFHRMIHSPFGRVLKGMRDDETAVMSLGRNVSRFKTFTFFISSGFIGLAGFIFATYVSYIDPTSFNLDESIFILTAVLIGGTGNMKGPVAGALFVVILPELIRFIGLPDNVAANWRQIIYGVTIIYFMRKNPRGIAGEFDLK